MLRRPPASDVEALVHVKVEAQAVLLRQVEHAAQLVDDAVVAVDERAERAARARHLARDALARGQVREQVERRERHKLQLDAAAPFIAQRLEHGQRGRRLGLHPVEVRAQRARARVPSVVQRAFHAQAQRRTGPAVAVLVHALDGREQVALRRAHVLHGVVLVDVRVGFDQRAQQRAACLALLRARNDGLDRAAGQRDVEHVRVAGVEAAQRRGNAQRLELHARCCKARSQPRPADVPPGSAPRLGRYSQPTQPCQPHCADTSSSTSNRYG
jgi:hypothetical protein